MLPSPRTGEASDPKVNIGFRVNVVAAWAQKVATRRKQKAKKRDEVFIGLWLLAVKTISPPREPCQLNFCPISIGRLANHECPDWVIENSKLRVMSIIPLTLWMQGEKIF
jgi:hypothetical protein